MPENLQEMYQKIDRINQQDPRVETVEGENVPKEWIYGLRMTNWLERLDPNANDAVKIAVRGQHIARWEIPRTKYPNGKSGYYQWRTRLYQFHGEKLAELMREVNCPEESIQQVQQILLKKDMKTNPDTQIVEDVAALVFLSFHLEAFAHRPDMTPEKVISIIRKTWGKMSDSARKMVKTIIFTKEIESILQKALQSN
jgi:hypothetical protein